MKQGSGNISVGGGKIELCGGIAGVGGLASDLILLRFGRGGPSWGREDECLGPVVGKDRLK